MPTPPYQRRSVFARWGVEIMLSRWHPGGASAPHDHGGGCGVVVVLTGRAEERRDAPQQPILRQLWPGRAIWCGRRCEHTMTAGPSGARMLHLYWGVHRGMRMRGRDGRRIEVPADHGAWWPSDTSGS